MGREVRMVRADWEHPKEYNYSRGKECFIPMHYGSFADAYEQWETEELPQWLEGRRKWAEGFVTDYSGGWKPRDPESFEKYPLWEDYAGTCPISPDPKHYMPDWDDSERTHFMMYEDTSEGTPISPAFATAEELAQWLADTGASSFADFTATYDQWLATIRRGSSISMVVEGGKAMSGAEAGV